MLHTRHIYIYILSGDLDDCRAVVEEGSDNTNFYAACGNLSTSRNWSA
jgi:hypothetical protein